MLLYFGIFLAIWDKKERFLRLFFYFFIKNYDFHMKKPLKSRIFHVKYLQIAKNVFCYAYTLRSFVPNDYSLVI